MGVISGGQVLGSYHGPILGTAAPSAGTNEVQSLATGGTPAGGTFRLKFDGVQSGTIAYNEGTANLQTKLEAIATIGTDNVLVGGSALNNAAGSATTVTFQGSLAKKNVSTLTLVDNQLTGGTAPTVNVTVSTPGVDADGRDAATGEMFLDVNAGKLYINTSTTAVAPTWTVVGAQS